MYSIPKSVGSFVARMNEESSAMAVRDFLADGQVILDGTQSEHLGADFWSASRPRAEGRKAHSWFFIRQWNSAVSVISDDEKLAVVEKFATYFPVWKESTEAEGSMAYHDESAAQRVMNECVFLANYGEYIEKAGFYDFELNLKTDIEFLCEDYFYAGENNHGMFQNIALLVAYEYGFADADAQKLAIDRLVRYFDQCFTEDGIHTENNPTYHVMVSNYLKRVSEYLESIGELDRVKNFGEILARADLYAAYCVMPNGKFPPISDTKLSALTLSQARGPFGDGYFLGALTNGKQGTVPSSDSFVAEKSGYAIFRTGWGEDASVAFFSAAYNADYHKHSDELSIYVYANGQELLAEAGPNGYQYKDPLTAYAFSSFAHNTLIVDDKGLRRIDDNADTTKLRKDDVEGCVTGSTGRYPGVSWNRKVDATDFKDSHILRIEDTVSSLDEHNYKFLWHLGIGITPVVRGNYIELFSDETKKKVGELYVANQPFVAVEVFRGQRHPKVQGFSFPAMGKPAPTYTVQFEVQGNSANPRWEFRTADFQIVDRGINPFDRQWHTFAGEKPVRCLVDVPNTDSVNEAVIVFSAINPLNDFTYNYRDSLKGYRGAVIYVLDDFGDQGSYYLANAREFAEYRSVQAALRSILSMLDLSPRQVFALGSSKGGTGAVIHGTALGVNTVFVGGPQYKIGSFTQNPHPNVLEYVAGGTEQSDVQWLDAVMQRLLRSGSRDTKLVALVGKADWHYETNVIPLIDVSRQLGYQAELLDLPGSSHKELGATFKKFVKSFVEWRNGTGSVYPYSVSFDAKTKEFGLAVYVEPEWEVVAQLLINCEKEGKHVPVRRGVVSWSIKKAGQARVRVYVDKKDGRGRQAFGTPAVKVAP